MNKKHTPQLAFFNFRILLALLCAVAACSLFSRPVLAFLCPEASTNASQRTLTFAQRVAYQRAIEEVYWLHRIWPKENVSPKPSLDAVMSQAQLENKVEDYLRNAQTLEDHWQRPISADDLQAEMDRMAEDTKQPDVLREIFEALGNDPFVIAECLARPVLSERLITSFAEEQENGRLAVSQVGTNSQTREVIVANASYSLPAISDTTGCTPNTWTATSTTQVAHGRYRLTAIWTGSEMIVWGGTQSVSDKNTGKKYTPSTDSWIGLSTTNAPEARDQHTAVWTGNEMIVWGGFNNVSFFNTGGRYNPTTNSWTATSITNAPTARDQHTAVWTGSEMIVWGGYNNVSFFNTGGRYNSTTNSWTATSITNAPTARDQHTAVWTGTQMIIWGGTGSTVHFNSGARYNPGSNSWTATSTTNAPAARFGHTAVWTTGEMIVWGGVGNASNLNTGGRYDPAGDSWTATSTTNVPTAREQHTAVWTGLEMIVWGGGEGSGSTVHFNTGGRYNPGSDSWTATSTTNAPAARYNQVAVWTGSEMIIFAGVGQISELNTGGRYCADSPSILANISTRAFVQTGDNVTIGGFIVQGTGPKTVIIRGIGPELSPPPYNIPNALADPTLQLHNSTGASIASNDNWQTTVIGGIITADQVAAIQTSGHAPTQPKESAIIATLQPGDYTAIMSGVNNTTGVGLVEVYDLGTGTGSVLGNISTRSFVQTGDDVMIGGFIVQGTQPKTVIIRAIGPELGLPPYNLPNPLANPTLALYSGQNLLASNDNWQSTIIGGIITANQVSAIRASGHAPTLPSESAIIATLQPGDYTAIVSGVNNTTGVALVEVYDLD
jgi:N-acetylneuraminic acid mutarotase